MGDGFSMLDIEGEDIHQTLTENINNIFFFKEFLFFYI